MDPRRCDQWRTQGKLATGQWRIQDKHKRRDYVDTKALDS